MKKMKNKLVGDMDSKNNLAEPLQKDDAVTKNM